MSEPIQPLKPAQRKALQQSLADCIDCGSKLDYLRQIGRPQEELEARVVHLQATIEQALTIDRESQSKGR